VLTILVSALKQLGLKGSLPQAYVKWIEIMKALYSGIDGNDALNDKLARLKITKRH
jgi:hypothetical protein